MELLEQGIQDREAWEKNGCKMFGFSREVMKERTLEAPVWLHFGAGNIFRAFPADIVQEQLEQGRMNCGLIAVEGYDYEIIDRVLRPHDELSLLVTLKTNGTAEKKVIGSIAASYRLDQSYGEEWAKLRQFLSADSLQMLSFTITEKGYAVKDRSGNLLPQTAADIAAGPKGAKSYLGKVTALLYERFLAGAKPLALVSMDNCSKNGEKLSEAILEYARGWERQELIKAGFLDYISDPAKISFPWTMIDKITPRPDEQIYQQLKEEGFTGMETVITEKQTYTAAYVNAEECGYLIIEDWFPNGRPDISYPGVWFTDRTTVERAEKMKVCTCLNPLHTALAVLGCLLGYSKISEEMKDPLLLTLVQTIGAKEGLPVVVHPGILEPEDFLREVVEQRLPNSFLPDTPQRIATDTSQKIPIRFGETLKAYQIQGGKRLTAIPVVLAGWLRYLIGVDDNGTAFTPSPDPRLEELQNRLSGIRLGSPVPRRQLEEILSDESLFGLDLMQTKEGETVIAALDRMLQGPGAVRDCLKETLMLSWKKV